MHIYTIFSWISYTICLPLFFFIIIILFFFVFFSSLFSVFFSVWLGLVWVAHAITTTPWPLPFWPSSLFGWRWVAPVAPDIVTLEANSKTSTRRQFVFTSALAPLLQLFFLFSYLAALLLFWFWFVFLFFFFAFFCVSCCFLLLLWGFVSPTRSPCPLWGVSCCVDLLSFLPSDVCVDFLRGT